MLQTIVGLILNDRTGLQSVAIRSKQIIYWFCLSDLVHENSWHLVMPHRYL
jgi:hypothetical protein